MMSAPKKVLTAKKPAQEEKPQEQKKVHKNSVKKENKGTKNNAKNADNWGGRKSENAALSDPRRRQLFGRKQRLEE